MTQAELLQTLRRPQQTTLYKLTGPPAHWLTTYHTGFWGLNAKHERTWKRLRPGDLALFHSTNPTYLSDRAIQSGVIGVGRISGSSRKETFEWYDEITNGYNGWPFLLHFSEIWWFGDTGAVRDEPFRDKLARGAGALVREARALTAGAISFGEMTVPGVGQLIPAMGSVSRVGNPAAFVPLVEPRLDGVKPYRSGESTEPLSSSDASGSDEPSDGHTYGSSKPGRSGTAEPPREENPPQDGASAPATEVSTGSRTTAASVRVGQGEFSRAVRANYGHRCCFPGCDVADDAYLVGAHVVRWADDDEARGRVDNGLCLCLMHDQAFEQGHFFVYGSGRVGSSSELVGGSKWAREHVLPYVGSPIQEGDIPPHRGYLAAHRARVQNKVRN